MNERFLLILISLTFVGSYFTVLAQGTPVESRTITWQSSQVVEKHGDASVPGSWSLLTSPSSVTLSNGAGTDLSFTVSSVEGSWSNENEDGEILFRLAFQGEVPGWVRIRRIGQTLVANVDFTEQNADGLLLELSISSFE
jgi:hypothetical protein